MKKPLSKKFRPSVMGLEGRRLMTTGILPTGPGNTHPTVPVLPSLPAGSDTTLTVATVTDHRVNPATSSLVIDGSDYDDHVDVFNYVPGKSVMVDLQKWSGGVEFSDTLVTVNLVGLKLQPSIPLQILGRGGDDHLTNDTSIQSSIDGGTGNDQLKDGPGGGLIIGGDGNDTLIGGAAPENLQGGNGDDYIRGGDGNDFIDGGPGNNILYGDGGNDTIYATGASAANHQQIHGGDGNDTITGGAGNDAIYGDGGNDYILGEAGGDQIHGGDGNDIIFGDSALEDATDGNDTINGDAGDDVIHGEGGNDVISGDDGNDRLFGDSGQDYLYGGNGNDYLDGGFIAYGGTFNNFNVPDVLYGGAGADTFVRHRSVLSSDDIDIFADYNKAQGDSTDDVWHLYD